MPHLLDAPAVQEVVGVRRERGVERHHVALHEQVVQRDVVGGGLRTAVVGQGLAAEPPQPVEPFNLRPLEAAGRGDADMSPRRQHLRRMDRGGFIHRNDPERLIALLALHALDHQPRAFVGGLVAVAPKHGDMQQHVGPAIVGNDEAVAL